MDIWEANSISEAYTPHPCNQPLLYPCNSDDCNNHCDKIGCDFNTYRMNVHDFYGPGGQFKIDTTKPFTVVTQYITQDETENSDIVEIRRKFI